MSPNHLRTAIFGVVGVTLLSKILGFLREIVIADRFGTSADYDLYLIAIMMPALFYGVLNYAGFYLLVPYFIKKLQNSNDDTSWRSMWPVINFVMITAFGLALLIAFSAPLVMRIWAGDFSDADYARVVWYCRLVALIVVLGTSEASIRAYLNARKIFTYPAASYIIFNLISIACILAFYRQFSVGAVAIGMLAGLACQNLYLLIRLWTYRPWAGFTGSLFNTDVRSLLATAGFLVIIELINRSYFMIDRYFAVDMGEGIISGLNYSQILVQLPDAVVGFAIASVLFPLFSEKSDITDGQFASLYRKAITAAVFIAVPLAVFFYVNASDIIYLVFHRGAFDTNSVHITSSILRPYTPTIIALFVVSTSIRACYSSGMARLVLGFTLILFVVKFIATAVLQNYFGYPGISAATSIAWLLFASLMLSVIVCRTKMSDSKNFIFTLIKIFISGLILLVAGYYITELISECVGGISHIQAAIRIAISLTVFLAVYIIIVIIMGLKPLITNLLTKNQG